MKRHLKSQRPNMSQFGNVTVMIASPMFHVTLNDCEVIDCSVMTDSSQSLKSQCNSLWQLSDNHVEAGSTVIFQSPTPKRFLLTNAASGYKESVASSSLLHHFFFPPTIKSHPRMTRPLYNNLKRRTHRNSLLLTI
jgi:hypothetical protein